MNRHTKVAVLFILILLFPSCSIFRENLDEKYQPLATPILSANGLLIVQFPEGLTSTVSGDDYKLLLKDGYENLYEIVLPYEVIVEPDEKYFKVSVFDGETLILTDWSCTENRIDCWSYNDDCQPENLQIECD